MTTFRTLQKLGFVLSDGKPVASLASEHPRPHQAAGSGRRTASWYAPGGGPNHVTASDLDTIRRRSRAAYRNQGFLKLGLKRNVSNEIGTHIRPAWEIDDENIRGQLRGLWNGFVKTAVLDSPLSLYGALALASLTRRMAGECFIRIRTPRNLENSRVPVPMQIQVLEPEYCPITETRITENGNEIIQGVEFSPAGRRVAYWMYRRHPDEYYPTGQDAIPVRVPAAFVLHHYLPERPGQIRGEPETVQSLVESFDYHEYRQAEAVRKKAKAAHTAVIERPIPESADELDDGPPDYDEASSASQIQPGMYNILMPGESVKFPDGDNTGSGYSEFQKWSLLGQAAGFAQPYQIYTGDMSGINDRLWRAMMIEFDRHIKMDREHGTIHQILEPLKNSLLDIAYLAGRLAVPNYQERQDEIKACQWQPDAKPYLNKLQDVQADALELAMRTNSREQIMISRGRDKATIDEDWRQDPQGAVDASGNPINNEAPTDDG